MADIDYGKETKNVRAVIRSAWGGSGYRTKTVREIENYYVETSLDSDADQWSITVGDPEGDMLGVFQRDAEAQVKIFGVGASANAVLPLLTGIADDIAYSDGSLEFSGRDYSALALDSAIPPKKFQKIRADLKVAEQAKELGFTGSRIARNGPEGPMVRKVAYTDGSESYWQFWQRLIRRERMWLWTEPDGVLIGDRLKYSAQPAYYFGRPRRGEGANVRAQYIPVESLAIKKTMQARNAEIWVYGHKGDNGFLVIQKDPTTKHWIKRTRKMLLDTDAHNAKQATKSAWEEFFEGKVGSLEYLITISDPGFRIRQNEIAVINLPDPGLSGTFFVVGIRTQLGQEGFLQEIRLREREYAISRRVPSAPKITTPAPPTQVGVVDEIPDALDAQVSVDGVPEGWSQYFINAANKHYGNWDYDLFLATLMGIADVETSFKNVRAFGGPGNGDHVEWYPWKAVGGATSQSAAFLDKEGRNRQQWETIFANDPGQYVTHEWAVGPMQLHDTSYKVKADKAMNPNGAPNQFAGGRWHPEFNIMVGAEILIGKLEYANHNSGRDIDMWSGVSAYYGGVSPGEVNAYGRHVKNKVMNDPGYLKKVKDAKAAAVAANKSTQQKGFQDQFPDTGDSDSPETGFNNSPKSLAQLKNLVVQGAVDIRHVNYELLRRVNALGFALSRQITITSGYRAKGKPGDKAGAGPNGTDTQEYLYAVYRNSGFSKAHIAANPSGYGSNHMHGEAVDATIGGVALWSVVPAATGAIYKIHGTVADDPVHTTRLEVTG